MKAVLKLCILMGRIHIYSYKRKDYTYAATSPPHLTILMKAIL